MKVTTALVKSEALYIMSEQKDFSGLKFNRLTVIGDAPSRREPSGKLVKRVIVRCDCGVEKDVAWKTLKRGQAKSCGCLAEEIKTNIQEGDIFTHWTVLNETEGYFSRNGEKSDRAFNCICVCGKKKSVNRNSLTTGQSKSCGCQGRVKKEKVKLIPEDTDVEIWKQCFTFSNYYISNLGRVYSIRLQTYLKESDSIKTKNLELLKIKELYRTFYGAYDEKHITLFYEGEPCAENIRTREINTVRYTKLKGVYNSMHNRCYRVTNKSYPTYGAKGVKIEESFNTFHKFFDWAIKNGYKEGLEIDRIESDKGYCSSNCRFITKEENNLRNKLINLTLDDVKWIRSDDFTYEEALDKFTCSKNVISNIRNYITFKDI